MTPMSRIIADFEIEDIEEQVKKLKEVKAPETKPNGKR